MNYRKKTGITIIETVAAIGVILSVTVGAFALIIAGTARSSTIKNRLVALNLAQEGIEIIRSFRDGNVITKCKRSDGTPDWRGVVDTTPPCLSIDLNDSSGAFYEIDKKSMVNGAAVITPPRKLKFCPTSGYADYGFYVYSCAGGDPAAYDSPFARQITISTPANELICVTTCPPDAEVIIPSRDRMNVAVTVLWRERGIDYSVVQSEIMYNWR